MTKKFTLEECAAVKEGNQPWFNSFLFEPIHDRCTWLIVNYTRLTPNFLSLLSFIFGIITTILFFKGNLILGGIFFELRNIGDTMDGRVARLKKIGSSFGAYYDNYVGTWSVFLNFFALSYFLYSSTADISWLLLMPFMFFLTWFHGFEGLLVSNVVGGKKAYKGMILKKNDNQKENQKKSFHQLLLNKFFNKYKLTPPPDASDIQHLMFFVAPILNLFISPKYSIFEYFAIAIIVLAVMASIYWFIFYRNFLNKYDQLKNLN
jgi:hypothetical protein